MRPDEEAWRSGVGAHARIDDTDSVHFEQEYHQPESVYSHRFLGESAYSHLQGWRFLLPAKPDEDFTNWNSLWRRRL
jgi:hypothetical protein